MIEYDLSDTPRAEHYDFQVALTVCTNEDSKYYYR